MKRPLLALAGLVMAVVSIPPGIEACGDKFMLPGRGLSFDEVYKARYPGAVLIYSPAGASKTDYTKLQTLLTRVGHRVTVVREAHQVASTASAIKADVLVTPLADAGTVGSQAKWGPLAPAILSVLATGNKAEKAACKLQPYVCEVKAEDSPEKFIVAVNETMTDRKQGAIEGRAAALGMRLIVRMLAIRLAAAVVVAGTASPVSAQMVPARGEGSVSVLYQGYSVDWHLLADGTRANAGTVSSRGVMVDFTVGLGKNFGLSVAVPFVSARYVGPFPHDTLTEEERLLHPSFRVLDDGEFHSAWQDLRVELRYAMHKNGLHLMPFVKFILPTHNYEYLGHATVGRNVKEARVGVALHRSLSPLSARSFVQSHVAYAFQEQIAGPRRGATHMALDGGYFLTPDLTVFGSAMIHVTHGGLDWNIGPRAEYSGLLFLNHDRASRERMFNLGVGASYSITRNYSVIGSVARTLWGINGHSQKFLLTVGCSRSFGRAAHDH